MKISLAWLFDHLNGDWQKVDVPALVDLFNLKVAEIEHFKKVTIDPKNFTVIKVLQSELECVGYLPALNQNITLAARSDLQINHYYLLKKLPSGWTWATGLDLHGTNDLLLPPLNFANDQLASLWHEQIELVDYILEVDNKSLTHRPDMWGHRGFAREIGLLLGLDLLPEEQFFTKLEQQDYENKFVANQVNPISAQIQNKACTRFATLYLPQVVNLPSQLKMAARLLRVDARSINWLIDLTNYVMLDISQPMHAFDADLIAGQQLAVRLAQPKEELALLGGQKIILDGQDLVVSDQTGPVALAGIKGGLHSGINSATKNLLLEAANFDATTIRRTAARHKIRTEASARFEKTLDPSQNILALQRFVNLYQQVLPNLPASLVIVALGEPVVTKQIELVHDFIEKRLGVILSQTFVINTLTKLGFGVVPNSLETGALVYQVTVPAWRASKDINLAIDLVEELARTYGYDRILPILPSTLTQPGNLEPVLRLRLVKQLLASMGMHEVENYPFYDESFLQTIHWQPQHTVEVLNPVSENWRRLVTSLIIHLCKNVAQETHDYLDLRYFEWGRIWYPKDQNAALELKSLAGVFSHKNGVDFYQVKSYLTNFFNMLKLEVTWQKPTQKIPVWFDTYQTAVLVVGDQQIGMAGKLSPAWVAAVGSGEIFAFELDGDFILRNSGQKNNYQTASKYQATSLDISLLVPLAKTVSDIQQVIKLADHRIYQVELVDSFKKEEWLDKKSLTFRYFFVDQEKTLSGAEIAIIQQQVEAAIQKNGAQIR